MKARDDDARFQKIDGVVHAQQIASLNDTLRQYRISGRMLATAGVIALGDAALPAILQLVAGYDRFDDGNDPYGEHDFGSFDYAGERLIWKIDYYSRDMSAGSPNPANPAVTTRVLTIMLTSEY